MGISICLPSRFHQIFILSRYTCARSLISGDSVTVKQSGGIDRLNKQLIKVRGITEKLEIDFRDGKHGNNICGIIAALLHNNQSVHNVVLWLPANCITDDGAMLMVENLKAAKR